MNSLINLSDYRKLSKQGVEKDAPDSPGVYGLWNEADPEAIFYGAAQNPDTIRSMLLKHVVGDLQPSPPEAKTFAYKVYPPPAPSWLESLIESHEKRHGTRPRYNRGADDAK